MKKKLLSILLSLVLTVGLLPTTALAETSTSLDASFTGGVLAAGSYQLTEDVEVSTSIQINSSSTVNLDLNGHGLTMTGTGPVIKVYGTLNLTDTAPGANTTYWKDEADTGRWIKGTSTEHTHTLTGGYITGGTGNVSETTCYGGGVYVTGSGVSFNMTGGTIVGNGRAVEATSASYGGGVYVGNGSFTMSGGAIKGNSASMGGGVHVRNYAAATLSDGTIAENTSSGHGGGVYVSAGTFTMSGGSITGNNSNSTANSGGGGVYASGYASFTMSGGSVTGNNNGGVYNSATMSVSGAVTINNNFKGGTKDAAAGVYTQGTSGQKNNVYLVDATIDVTGSLSGAAIGVNRSGTVPTVIAEGKASSTGGDAYILADSDEAAFTSDAADRAIQRDSDSNQLKLVAGATSTSHTVTLDLGGGTGTPADFPTTAAKDAEITLPSLTKTGHTHVGWVDNSDNVFFPGESYTMPDADVTLTALWTEANASAVAKVDIGSVALNSTTKYYHNATGSAAEVANSNVNGASAMLVDGVLVLRNLNVVTSADARYYGIHWVYNNSGNDDLVIYLLEGTVNRVKRYSDSAINGATGTTGSGPSLAIRGNGLLKADGAHYGIWVWQNITVESGVTLIAEGGIGQGTSTNEYSGIANNTTGTIKVESGATVVARGGQYGMLADAGYSTSTLTVEDGADFTASGGNAALKDLKTDSTVGSKTLYVGTLGEAPEATDTAAKKESATGFSYDALKNYDFISTKTFSITGTAAVGETLTADLTTRTDLPAISVMSSGADSASTTTYQWKKINKDTGATTDISGAAGNTYEVTADDAGSYLTVTATIDGKPITARRTALVPTGETGGHDHSWTFELNTAGDTITHKCTATECTLDGQSDGFYKISAPTSLTYDGMAKAATVSGNIASIAQPTITYKVKNGTGWDAMTTTSTDVGTYQASITLGEGDAAKTASVTYTITMSFNHAYDAQRSITNPKNGDKVRLSQFKMPYKPDRGQYTTTEGPWTLTLVGTYESYEGKSTHAYSSNLGDIAGGIASQYGGTQNNVPIYALKKGADVIYGVIQARGSVYNNQNLTGVPTDTNGVLFVGATGTFTGSGGTGYFLTTEGGLTAVVTAPSTTAKRWMQVTRDASGATATTVTVSFNMNCTDAVTGMPTSDMTATIGGTITLPTTEPTRTGYTFGGWYQDAACADADKVTNATVYNANTTLYAKWSVVNYTIAYTLNGGAVATANPTTYNVETETFTLNNPTKAHYDFLGWTGSNGTTAQTSVSIAKGSHGDKTYTANWKPTEYTITYVMNGGTNHADNPETYTVESDAITLKNPTRKGYTFLGWSGTGLTGTTRDVTIAAGSTGERTFTAHWMRHDASLPLYDVEVSKALNGAVVSNRDEAREGSIVTITVAPAGGFALEKLTVTDSKGNSLTLTAVGGNQYTFIMPASDVEVRASFTDGSNTGFVDVTVDKYFYDAVLWAVDNGITGGTSATTFSPYASCTRGQLVTFLWRAAGEPRVKNAENPFTDVKAGTAFYQAILWAAENEVVNGYADGTFKPNAPVTRQQAAAILWRFAKAQEVDVSVGEDTNILSYADAFDVAEYAIPAMQWAVGAEVLQGNGDKLLPHDTCTRAQMVTFLYRFLAE